MVLWMRRFTIPATSITELYFATVVNADCVGIVSRRDEPFEVTRKNLRESRYNCELRAHHQSYVTDGLLLPSCHSVSFLACFRYVFSTKGFKRAKTDVGLV